MENLFNNLTQSPPRGSLEAKIEAELIRTTYRSASFGVYINGAVPAILVGSLWSYYSHTWPVIWAAVCALIALLRLALHRKFFQKDPSEWEMPKWANAFRFGVMVTALCWGIGAWFLLGSDEAAPKALTIFVISGLCAGAARSLSFIPWCFAPYSVVVLFPIIIRSATVPEDAGWAMALMTFLYVLFLNSFARGQRAELTAMHRTLFENEMLMADLRSAKDKAEVANKAKSEFLSTISHELHTPMHGVIGMLQLLEESELDKDQKLQVSVALTSANALHGILKDILDFSRIESNRLELTKAPYFFPELLREAAAFLGTKAQEKGLDSRIYLSPNLPNQVLGDSARLKQVLFHLISNAAKFTDRGMIEFSVRPVMVASGLEIVRFAVRDTGMGIPASMQDQLFERFVQGNGSSSRRHGGVGLGLSIAQQIVWRMGGEVKVSSEVGKGSEFSFEIPLERTNQGSPDSGPVATASVELLEGRVLVVEDDFSSQQVVEMMLKRWGLHVTVVSSGEEALSFLQGDTADVVLMDVRLSGISGVDTALRLRSMGHRMPVVALTAGSTPTERKQCLEAGMDGFLSKPLDPAELHRSLRRWLRLRP